MGKIKFPILIFSFSTQLARLPKDVRKTTHCATAMLILFAKEEIAWRDTSTSTISRHPVVKVGDCLVRCFEVMYLKLFKKNSFTAVDFYSIAEHKLSKMNFFSLSEREYINPLEIFMFYYTIVVTNCGQGFYQANPATPTQNNICRGQSTL